MTKWVCKYCIATRGLKGSELDQWPEAGDEESIVQHLESQHHIPVRREGESEAETDARFCAAYPEAGGPDCRCPTCHEIRRLKRLREAT